MKSQRTQTILTKTTSFAIIVTVLGSNLASTIKPRPPKKIKTTLEGCFYYSSQNQSCTSCFEREPEQGACLDFTPRSSCQIYSLQNGQVRCTYCRKGFSYNVDLNQCVKKSLRNCIYSIESNNKLFCQACKPGFYSTKAGCIDQKDLPAVSQNCLWGGYFDANKRTATCFRCQPGFSHDMSLNRCVPQEASVEGCAISLGTICTSCDVWSGYSMQSDQTCVKTRNML